MLPKKVSISAAFDSFEDHWSPRIAADINDMQVKLVKAQGDFVWHHHDDEDELFLIIEGTLTMRFRDGDVELNPGELIVVPKGVEHQPIADDECKMLVFEKNTTLNTGYTEGVLTARNLPRV